jgi:sirohydrochlorin ferrochelatase
VSATLLAAAHGTRSATGTATTRELVSLVAARRPSVRVELCFLDVRSPRLRDAATAVDGPIVVVPLLLSSGYHVVSDIPAAIADHPSVTATRPIGPDPRLTELLVARLAAVGGCTADVVALAVSPSKYPAAAADVATVAHGLSGRLDRPVEVVTVGPDLADRLYALRSGGRRLAVCQYLLAEGHFADAVHRAAPTEVPVAAPFGADPVIADLILRRYDDVGL